MLLCLSAVLAQETAFTFILKHDIDQSDQFIQLQLSVQAEGRSLKNADSDAASIIAAVQGIVQQYCLENGRNKAECSAAVSARKYSVEPKYHLVRKVQTFTIFILTHKLTISIRNIATLGKMIDEITKQGRGMVTLNSFDWKAQQEVDSEIVTLKEGLQEGRELCQKMGLGLLEVLSVEEQTSPVEQQVKGDEEQEEEKTEAEQKMSILKFKVKCSTPTKRAKGKK